MSTRATQAALKEVSTEVPVDRGRQVAVPPGDPWLSAYRGSKYSVVTSRKHGEVAQWSHMGAIQAMTALPKGIQEAMRSVGKPNGKGSFRLTASGEVLTKVPADRYDKVGDAQVTRGHIPVYLGRLDGSFDFEAFSNDPPIPSRVGDISVWTGLPFSHGETWVVTTDDVLRWSWQDYYFESVFDHSELVETYKQLRPPGGRIYINEHGHVWGNIDRSEVPTSQRDRVTDAFRDWQQTATNAEQRLVTRRLQRTQSEAVADGLLPVYLGHLSQFDDGLVPKPIVEDKSYFMDTAMKPE